MIVADFANFCLHAYVLIDDLWESLPACVKPRGMVGACSNSELVTMVLVEGCMGWEEETVTLSYWHEHRDLFLHVPHRTRANWRHALTDALILLRQRFLARLDDAFHRQCVIDSLPASVLGFHLVPGAVSAGAGRAHGADNGKVITKKRTGALCAAFGYTLHLLITLGGVIGDFVLAPASVNDHLIAPALLDAAWAVVVLGDKGYISAPLATALREGRRSTRATPLRSNQKPPRTGLRATAQRDAASCPRGTRRDGQ